MKQTFDFDKLNVGDRIHCCGKYYEYNENCGEKNGCSKCDLAVKEYPRYCLMNYCIESGFWKEIIGEADKENTK